MLNTTKARGKREPGASVNLRDVVRVKEIEENPLLKEQPGLGGKLSSDSELVSLSPSKSIKSSLWRLRALPSTLRLSCSGLPGGSRSHPDTSSGVSYGYHEGCYRSPEAHRLLLAHASGHGQADASCWGHCSLSSESELSFRVFLGSWASARLQILGGNNTVININTINSNAIIMHHLL